jgi:hypothetical protein
MSSEGFKNLAKLFYVLLIIVVCIAIYLWLYPTYEYVYPLIPVFIVGFILSIIGYWIFRKR